MCSSRSYLVAARRLWNGEYTFKSYRRMLKEGVCGMQALQR